MAMIPDADREFLKNRFEDELQNEITIAAFTKKAEGTEGPGLKCEFCKETEELVSELAELSDKIKVETHAYSADDRLVKNLGIDKLPALVVMSDRGNGVRYFGIPGGFEFSALVEDIIDISRNATDLSQEVKDKVRGISEDVNIQVFVTPTCPYCPSAVRIAHQMAIENPQHVRADAIEAGEFPHLVSHYDITAVPTIVINEQVQFEGALPEEDFAEQVTRALAA